MSLLEEALKKNIGTSNHGAWIGFDLDGTLANDSQWLGPDHIGPPIPGIVELIKMYLKKGHIVKIMTARMSVKDPEKKAKAAKLIADYTAEHIGVALEATCEKDYQMIVLYDDRARQVIANTGIVVQADPNTSVD